MATNRRDIELFISARETTGRSFKQVTDNITALNTKIGEQVAAAERGEGSLRDLRATQEALAQAGRDLSGLQAQIDGYNRLDAAAGKIEQRFTDATAKLEAFKTELASVEKPTDAQERKLNRLEIAVEKAGRAFEQSKVDMEAQIAVLDRAGIAVDRLEEDQTSLVNSARSVGASLAQVRSGIENFGDAVRIARDKQKKADQEAAAAAQTAAAAETQAINDQKQAAIDGAARLKESADQRAASIKQMAQAESELSQQRGFYQKIEEAKRLGDASRFVDLFAQATQTVRVAENQLSTLTGFRAVGQMAVEASNDLSRFVTTGQTFAATSSAVAAGLRDIVDPGAAALRTLEGVEAAIDKASVAAGAAQTNVGALNTAYNTLSEATAALFRQGNLVDQFTNQENAVLTLRQQLEAAQADVRKVGSAMAAAGAPTEALANDLQLAETRLEQVARALLNEETKLGEMSRALKAAGVDSANLANEQDRLAAAARNASAAMGQIDQTLGRGGQKTNGFLGLKPHELTNLGYQVNDIIVSLASGQKPLTVLVQQGAQISQIFPGLISTVSRFALAWAPVVAVLGLVAAAISEVISDADRLKQASQDLATNPLGANIDVQKFADAEEHLEQLGVKAEDARSAMLLLLNEGFDDAAMAQYSETAYQLSQRLGVDLVNATELLTSIQQGGIDAVYDLTSKTHDLTDADLDHAEALFEAGKAAEARQFVLDRVAEKNAQIAKATESAWTPAVRNLQSAWNNFASWLVSKFEPILKSTLDGINDVIIGFTFLTGLLAGKGVEGAKADAFAAYQNINKKNQSGGDRGASDQSLRNREYLNGLEDEYNVKKKLSTQDRLSLAESKERAKAQAAGVDKATEELGVQKAIAAEQSKINDENAAAAKRTTASRNKAANAARAEENRRQSALQQLQGQLRQLNRAAFAGESASLDERLSAIDEKYASIYDTLRKLRGLGISQTADGQSLSSIEKQVEATKARLKSEESIKYYQDRTAALDKQRTAEVQRVTDLQTRGAIDTKTAMEQVAEINGRISPQIVSAANEALKIARALAGTNPSPEMVSWIASLERIVGDEAGNNIVAKVGLAGLDQQSDKLDKLLKDRDTLVESYKTLGEIGILTADEVRDKTTAAYAAQAVAIKPVLDEMATQIELLHNTTDILTGMPIITDTAYAAWQAKLAATNAGLALQDDRLKQLNDAARGAIQNGVATAFNAAAKGIVNLVSGSKSFIGVLGDIGTAALSVFGSILDAIAQVLIKMVALQFVNSVLPGSSGILGNLLHSGGVVGPGSTGMVRTGVSPAAWIGAPRFHDGGGLGLKKDEYAAILQNGEEVLTEDDPRHVNNAGSGGGGGGDSGLGIKQVLYLDPGEIANAMSSTRSGQKSILSVIKSNKETIKQVLK